MVSAIACIDENWGIGKDGELLFNIPEDLKFFQNLTKHNTVIMGRKTWESLPIRPLPQRNNIVISNQANGKFDGAVFMNLDEVKNILIKNILNPTSDNENYFVIGGGQIYKELLPYCKSVYLTHVYKKVEADTYFPCLNDKWIPRKLNEVQFYNDVSYQMFEWRR